MKKVELQKILENNNVPKKHYSLEGGVQNDTICFFETSKGNIWQVYYTERGEKMNLKEFYSEDDACDCFLMMLKRDGLLK